MKFDFPSCPHLSDPAKDFACCGTPDVSHLHKGVRIFNGLSRCRLSRFTHCDIHFPDFSLSTILTPVIGRR